MGINHTANDRNVDWAVENKTIYKHSFSIEQHTSWIRSHMSNLNCFNFPRHRYWIHSIRKVTEMSHRERLTFTNKMLTFSAVPGTPDVIVIVGFILT